MHELRALDKLPQAEDGEIQIQYRLDSQVHQFNFAKPAPYEVQELLDSLSIDLNHKGFK